MTFEQRKDKLDRENMILELRRIAMNLEHLAKNPMRADISSDFLRGWVQRIRRVAEKLETE